MAFVAVDHHLRAVVWLGVDGQPDGEDRLTRQDHSHALAWE
jgi:hypothetical protein